MRPASPNSGYAVRYRSPKPLRASHTRKTLSEMPKPTLENILKVEKEV